MFRTRLAFYRRDQLLVVLFENFYAAPDVSHALNEITGFLGLPDHDYGKDAGMALYEW